jgi:hypothetical protein
MVALNFDATAVPQSTGGFELLQPGEYRAEIVADEVKESKETPGNHYLELQVKIDGKGSVWDRLNLWNASPVAVEIGNEKLAEIAFAIGKNHIADSSEVLLKPLMVRVEIEPGSKGYADKNKIVRYMPIGTVAAPAMAQRPPDPVPPAAPPATTAPSQAATAKPVWQS